MSTFLGLLRNIQWFFKGGLEAFGQELGGAIVGDDHVVFAAQAEVAGDVDAGFVGESHVGLEGSGAGAN